VGALEAHELPPEDEKSSEKLVELPLAGGAAVALALAGCPR
jgi:hypothetical protein